MARTRKKPADEPVDPANIVAGATVTAFDYPPHTRYRKPVEISGKIRTISEDSVTIISGDGFHTVRLCDIIRARRVVAQ